MDVIDVTYALIRLKTSHIRRYWMLYPPSRLGCCHPTGTPLTNPYRFFRVSIKNRNSPTQPYVPSFLAQTEPLSFTFTGVHFFIALMLSSIIRLFDGIDMDVVDVVWGFV